MVRSTGAAWLGAISLMVLVAVTGSRADDSLRQITNSEGGYHCKWSPDGKQIVFVSRKTGEPKMYVVPAEGGKPVMVECGLSGDHHTGWSRDSKYLVFDGHGADGPPPRLWLIPITGGSVRPLVPNVIPAFQPALSPDGEWVAFVALRGGNSDIWRAKLSGDSLTRITNDSARDHHPQWSPDGKSIVFASDRSGNWDIWTVNIDGSGVRQITSSPELDDQPMLSPDGKLLAFMSESNGKRDIWLMPVDSGQAKQFTHDGTSGWPSFSPDGENLVWSGKNKLHVRRIVDK